jgi:altronate dehydratase
MSLRKLEPGESKRLDDLTLVHQQADGCLVQTFNRERGNTYGSGVATVVSVACHSVWIPGVHWMVTE